MRGAMKVFLIEKFKQEEGFWNPYHSNVYSLYDMISGRVEKNLKRLRAVYGQNGSKFRVAEYHLKTARNSISQGMRPE